MCRIYERATTAGRELPREPRPEGEHAGPSNDAKGSTPWEHECGDGLANAGPRRPRAATRLKWAIAWVSRRHRTTAAIAWKTTAAPTPSTRHRRRAAIADRHRDGHGTLQPTTSGREQRAVRDREECGGDLQHRVKIGQVWRDSTRRSLNPVLQFRLVGLRAGNSTGPGDGHGGPASLGRLQRARELSANRLPRNRSWIRPRPRWHERRPTKPPPRCGHAG